MTPFGEAVRGLRAERGITLKAMACDLQISAAYLSALEHGRKGRPSRALLIQVCEYFGIIWDDAEALERAARLSHPRVVVDTSGLGPRATELANRMARSMRHLSPATVEAMHRLLDAAERPRPGRRRAAAAPVAKPETAEAG
ncbi:transcriptional regulator with XRE-family HTH domain [Stella humosa]|uniref:Transcriptional regulator with XRE-family HTH domain n=1 Tax=Stella humosa TaxID=94 RepID=A0A3N1LJD6_9PROT|nr:helix-turn-helix domain-containing protein [Stella humosa]ROP90978.1 transcriptional regulator with XRE-family HTH domain [Stella humosa]BBK34672.1 transcriptional regulator [Stella humosa]